MSGHQAGCETKRSKNTRARTVIRVVLGDRHVGDILLDSANRVWRHADSIPADVVLKAVFALTRRSETQGTLTGRKDGRAYEWFVLGVREAESLAA